MYRVTAHDEKQTLIDSGVWGNVDREQLYETRDEAADVIDELAEGLPSDVIFEIEKA